MYSISNKQTQIGEFFFIFSNRWKNETKKSWSA